jgi:V-type H+-transporting ATPase proteolipid subunit
LACVTPHFSLVIHLTLFKTNCAQFFSTCSISGYAGAASCIILANFGSAWGTWRAGVGVCSMGVDYSKGVIKNIVPIVMAGVLGIYGLIVAVIIAQAITPPNANKSTVYSAYNGYSHVSG